MKISERKTVDAFDVEAQKYIGKFPVSILNKMYDQWRSLGYGVLLDRDGAICVDTDEPEDDGLYYSEQIKELEHE